VIEEPARFTCVHVLVRQAGWPLLA
jgi:hypothetical protein